MTTAGTAATAPQGARPLRPALVATAPAARVRGRASPTRRPTAGLTRLARVLALGGTSMLLATGGHLVGGGQRPAAALLVGLAVLVGTVATLVTSRRCRLPGLLALLGAEQILLHLVLDGATRSAACVAAPVAMGHHPEAGMVLICPSATSEVPAAVDLLASVSPLMGLGHLAATVLTAWLLARGEAALWGLADRYRRAVAAPAATWPSAAAALTLLLAPTRPRPVETHDAAPRGPPLG